MQFFAGLPTRYTALPGLRYQGFSHFLRKEEDTTGDSRHVLNNIEKGTLMVTEEQKVTARMFLCRRALLCMRDDNVMLMLGAIGKSVDLPGMALGYAVLSNPLPNKYWVKFMSRNVKEPFSPEEERLLEGFHFHDAAKQVTNILDETNGWSIVAIISHQHVYSLADGTDAWEGIAEE